MKFQTMSLIAGNHICNASCPFCVSRMTDGHGIELTKTQEINERNLHKAIQIAEKCDITSVIITGKGEPTLFPKHIDSYLTALENYKFPFIELQTNGWLLSEDELPISYKKEFSNLEGLLEYWHHMGMTTIMISNVGYDMELNRKTYFPKRESWIDLKKVINRCHNAGLIVRYTTVGIEDGVDTPEKFDKLIEFCDFMNIEQLTWRPVAKTADANTVDQSVNSWVSANGINRDKVDIIKQHVIDNGTKLYDLVHGASVYDFRGQNVCMSTCLTNDPTEETIRQLIYHPDGKLFTDWQYKGSRLL